MLPYLHNKPYCNKNKIKRKALQSEFDKIGKLIINKNIKRYKLTKLIDKDSNGITQNEDFYFSCKKIQKSLRENNKIETNNNTYLNDIKKKILLNKSKSEKYTIPLSFKPLAQIIGEKINKLNEKFADTTKTIDQSIKIGDFNQHVKQINPSKYGLNENNQKISKELYKSNLIKLYDRRKKIFNKNNELIYIRNINNQFL